MENVSALERIVGLTHEERQAAYDKARRRIAGTEPTDKNAPQRATFEDNAPGKYPAWITRVVIGLSVLMLTFAFLPSAMRLHAVALKTIQPIMIDMTSVYVAALSTVMMAEIGQLIFSMAAAVNVNRLHAGLLNAGAFICLAIALTGNIQAMGERAFLDTFSGLETLAPPCLVLITSYILKGQMLHAIETRHAAHARYDEAKKAWQDNYTQARIAWQHAYENAETNANWQGYTANALREALRVTNRGRAQIVRTLTDNDWYTLIQRERDADKWYMRVDTRVQARHEEVKRAVETRTIKTPGASGNGRHTGEFDDAVIDNADGTFTARCPHCEDTFVKDTFKGAKMALVAHKQKHNASVPTVAFSTNGNGTHKVVQP